MKICEFSFQGDAPGSVPQPKVAYAPCSFECDNKCVDTCPDYCCVKAMKDNLSASSAQPAVMSQPGQVNESNVL